MLNKKILIIDNEDQTDVLEVLKNDAGKANVILDYTQFNVGGALEPGILDAEGNLDIEATKTLYKERFSNDYFDIIACDYDLDVQNTNGVDLIRRMRAKCFGIKPRILMYSGLLDEIIKENIHNHCKIKQDDKGQSYVEPDNDLKKILKHLINADYIGFTEREKYCSIILQHLKYDVRLEDILDEVCTLYPDIVLNYNLGYNFEGRKLSDCRNELVAKPEIRTEVMKDMVQQTIFYLTKYIAKKD